MIHLLKQLAISAIFAVAGGAVAHAETVDFSGSLTATVSVDLAGRCASFPTFNAIGTGIATLLGDFTDVQSDCMTSDSSFDQGIFEFRSVSIPGDSLFGTHFAVASSQEGTFELTSILLVNGGTGRFANAFGALFGFGTLDEGPGILSETLSGQLETAAPEPRITGLVAAALAVLWLRSREGRANDCGSR
jgi:hypothetical protein